MEKNNGNQSELTVSQQSAYGKILKFLGSKERFFRLAGYAGTGKSFLVTKIIKWLDHKEFTFALASPTNKAAKNLQLICQKEGLSVDVTTLAKLLKLQPILDVETGNYNFSSTSLTVDSLNDFDVVIIDEFSMLSKENFQEILNEIKKSLTKVIFVGDEAQLPPVNEEKPIVSISNQIKSAAVLKEIIRYDGQIARVAEEIRSISEFNQKLYPFKTTSDRTIIKLSPELWLEKAFKMFNSNLWQENPDFGRIIAWRNKTVNNYNQIIRQSIYGANTKEFVVGEILIAKKPVFRGKKNNKKIILNTSEECRINTMPKIDHSSKYNWDFYNLSVEADSGYSIVLRVLTQQSEIERQRKLMELAEQAKETTDYNQRKRKWAMFYELDALFDNITYAYALTCHKAQGSSLDYVFLAVNDMQYCSDLQKILYTGLTRTKKNCFVC